MLHRVEYVETNGRDGLLVGEETEVDEAMKRNVHLVTLKKSAVENANDQRARRRPLVVQDSAEHVVAPRVTQASLPPVVLPSGKLECAACGGTFGSWETYYGHIIAPDNKVCAWIQINRIDVATPPSQSRRASGLFDADLVARWVADQGG